MEKKTNGAGASNPTGQDDSQKYENQRIRAEKAEQRAKAAESRVAELEGLSASGQATVSDEEVKAFSEEHDIEPSLAKALLSTAVKKSIESTKSIVQAELAKRDQVYTAQQQKAVFDAEFAKHSAKYGEGKVDKIAIEAVAKAQPDKTVEEIIANIYGEATQNEGVQQKAPIDKPESISIGDVEEGKVDFANMNAEQIEQAIANPEVQEKYFEYLDANES